MDKRFLKFANEVKFNVSKSFETVSTIRAEFNRIEGKFVLEFASPTIIPLPEMREFLKCVNSNFRYKSRLEFTVSSVIYATETIKEYLKWIVGDFLHHRHLASNFETCDLHIKDATASLEVPSLTSQRKFEDVKEDIDRIMRKFGFENFSFNPTFVEKEDIIAAEKAELEERSSAYLQNKKSLQETTEKKVNQQKQYVKVSLDGLAESNLQKVAIEGEVFNVVHKTTKSSYVITEISITNYKDAVMVKAFAKTDEEIKENASYRQGQYLYIQGDYQIDAYSKEPVIMARKIVVGENAASARLDLETDRRVELSARTRMSTMDGIATPAELVSRAKQWGHKAVAIVDKDGVQAFPDFSHALKGSGIKGIYGATFNTISRKSKALINPVKKNLDSDSYVVFDLETTGLSPQFHDIIEFGAVRIENGQIGESKQFFIKPTMPIPDEITKITSITDEMVAGGKPESEAIKDIRDFLGDATLVAHNSNFDITFVNEKLEKYGYKPINNPVIDTLVVSRILQPNGKKFRLENVATRYQIDYDSTIAHRADYDAEVLARVWVKMLFELANSQIIAQQDLADYTSDGLYQKAFSNEVSVIAKNQEGIKELFQLVSKASTDTFYVEPTLFIEDLAERKNVLLSSGTLRSRLVDRALFGSKAQVIEEIKLYDYIEVQPPKNFVHYYAKGFSEQNILDALTLIVKEAKKQNKLVVATGDVRYLDEFHKLYHEVYINAKGLGGVRHYLFSYGKNTLYPTLNFLTTDEMIKEFAFLEDIKLIKEIVVTNTQKIADRIEDVEIIKKDLYPPKMDKSDELMTEFIYKTARERYGDKLPERVAARIERELTPIVKYGFGIIYWISHLLVTKSLEDGYLVGSRGSVGSSIVATFLNITEVNPLEPHYICKKCKFVEFPDVHLNSGYDLAAKQCPECKEDLDRQGQNIPFETFLGFNADKVPDIDLNFSGEYQPIIHEKVKELFGETHSFRAGTISTVAEKTAYGYVLAWAEDNAKTISRAFTDFIAKGVTGTKRTTGQHPGGIIVIPKEMDVEDFTPINFPANDANSTWKTTHFDFHAIHDNVLKLDLLGHDDPTAIRLLEKQTKINAKTDIPFSDEKVLSLFSSTEALGIKPEDINGETTGAMGIPEFGTQFVRRMLKKAKVKSFGDLISVSGLSHGTDVWANNAELLVVQQNKSLDEVISCRDNIMTDLIEKKLDPLMSFKIMESVRKGKGVTEEQEAIMKSKGVEDWYIDSLKKIKYMFPKAHATAYVMMAWRVAWFKLYHPLAYYATYFTTRADVFDLSTIVGGKTETLNKLKELEARKGKRGEEALSNKEEELIPILELAVEAFARGIKIGNLDLKHSDAKEWIIDHKQNMIYPPFISLDGLGESVAESIVAARKVKPFMSVEDLQTRTSINKTTMGKLKDLGVLKGLNDHNQMALELF